MAGGDETTSGSEKGTVTALPDVPPGDQPLLHTAITFIRHMEDILAKLGLLGAAEGEEPAECAEIVDIDLTRLPMPKPSDRDYVSRLESRLKIEAHNLSNAAKRRRISLQIWSRVYGLVVAACKLNQDALGREIRDMCDLKKTSGITGGFFDGPRAYAALLLLLLHWLKQGMLGRSEEDKAFYESALALQLDEKLHLPDHCPSADFVRNHDALSCTRNTPIYET